MPNAYERARIAELAEGSRRAAKLRDCPRCGRAVIEGDDADDVALHVTVDADTLDLVDEMLAVFAGRATFTLERMRGKEARPGSHALWHRDTWRLHDPNPPGGSLHREHRCNPHDVWKETLI